MDVRKYAPVVTILIGIYDRYLLPVMDRVIFVIQTSDVDTKSGKSQGRKSPSGVQGQSPGRGAGGQSPQKLKHFVSFKGNC